MCPAQGYTSGYTFGRDTRILIVESHKYSRVSANW